MFKSLLCLCAALIGCVLPAVAGEGPREYSQEFEITFSSAETAAQATLKPLPVLDGKPWALSARWDDNHPGNLTMHDLMAKHGLKGNFYLNQTDARNRFGSDYVVSLLKGGFAIGGHTQSHPKLTETTPADLFYEVMANRVEREAQANMPIVSFAFPFGLWTTPDDPQAIVRITETLRRSGYHHCTYLGFIKDNPAIKPGDFSTCLQVMPGDHEIDAAKFDQNLQKILRLSKTYQAFSYNITLATHARQTGKAWDDLDKVFSDLTKQADWWYCNQNEYAAYERQFRRSRIERTSVSGVLARFRITRPMPAELGADVPLTVEAVGGGALSVKGDGAQHTLQASSGRALINLANDSRQQCPAQIDVIDNPGNAPAPTKLPVSAELGGIGAWLTIADDGSKANLALVNTGTAEVTDLAITMRLPLAYEKGVLQLEVASLKPGETQAKSLELGKSSEPAGRRYFVAEIGFMRSGHAGRLFATAYP